MSKCQSTYARYCGFPGHPKCYYKENDDAYDKEEGEGGKNEVKEDTYVESLDS